MININDILSYMDKYGYFFLAGIVFLEYLNLPGLPAGIIMPAAGILIKSRGLNFPFTLITSVIAGLLGSWCLYAIGYYCGNPIIDKIENSKINMNLQKLVIKQRGQIQTVAYESIIYIEGSNHNVYIYTDKKDIMVYDSLQQILKQISDDFYQCHRSFIINFNHVKRIEKEYVVMDNGEHVSVSRLKRKELSDLFFKYMGEKM